MANKFAQDFLRTLWSFWTDTRVWIVCIALSISLVVALAVDMTIVAWIIGGMSGVWLERATTDIGSNSEDA